MTQSSAVTRCEPASIRAALNYLLRTGRKPYAYSFAPPPGVPERHGEVNTVPNIMIRNARMGKPSLDEQGFEIRPHVTSVRDFYDKRQVKDVYYPEIVHLLKAATGAGKIVIFDHTIRSAHTAFDNPSTPPKPLPRENIEVRALAFLPPV